MQRSNVAGRISGQNDRMDPIIYVAPATLGLHLSPRLWIALLV